MRGRVADMLYHYFGKRLPGGSVREIEARKIK